MAGEWISQWIPTIIIIVLAFAAFSIIAYRLIGVGSTASIFDAEHNTIARELFINQSGYWIVTIQYAGGVYPVYGIVLKNGSLVKVNWPVPVYTAYNPVEYRFVEYNVYSPGNNPPVVVLLKVGSSIVGIKIMPEFRISLPSSQAGFGQASGSGSASGTGHTTTVATTTTTVSQANTWRVFIWYPSSISLAPYTGSTIGSFSLSINSTISTLGLGWNTGTYQPPANITLDGYLSATLTASSGSTLPGAYLYCSVNGTIYETAFTPSGSAGLPWSTYQIRFTASLGFKQSFVGNGPFVDAVVCWVNTTTGEYTENPLWARLDISAPSSIAWSASSPFNGTSGAGPATVKLGLTALSNTITLSASCAPGYSGSAWIQAINGTQISGEPSVVSFTVDNGSTTTITLGGDCTGTSSSPPPSGPTTTTPTSTTTPTTTSTPTSTSSTPPPTSPTTTVTYSTPIQVTTGIVFTCVGPSNIPIGEEAVEECVAGWAYTYTYGQLSVGYPTATNTYGPVVMSGTITLSPLYASSLTPVPQGFTWGYSGQCGPFQQPVVELYGPTINEPVWTPTYSVTWYVTIVAYCQPKGSSGFIFILPWEWNPPTLPIWLWLRGGTNTLAPLESVYIQAFNAYAEWFWASAGLFIDLLVLLALITPVLARPIISRRIRP